MAVLHTRSPRGVKPHPATARTPLSSSASGAEALAVAVSPRAVPSPSSGTWARLFELCAWPRLGLGYLSKLLARVSV